MSGVRAAVLSTHGAAPALVERPAPVAAPDELVVDVHAAPITPLDVLCASGTSYFGPPALPYVPGVQGVGVVRDGGPLLPAGTPVWFATSAGMAPGDGSLRSQVAVPASDVVALEHDLEPTLVAALGLSAVAAERSLARAGLRPGETVVVLGAGGVVGQVAVQLARLAGAGRVVAGCRSDLAAERAHRSGADEVVRLDTQDVDVLVTRFVEACAGGADVVVDPLCGAPASAALRALRPGGRLVNLGSSAGPTAELDSATVRGRSLSVLGYTNNALAPDERQASLAVVVGHAAAGHLVVDHEVVALGDVAEAWTRQQQGRASRRLVVDLTS